MTATPPSTFSGRRRRPPWARREHEKRWACGSSAKRSAERGADSLCNRHGALSSLRNDNRGESNIASVLPGQGRWRVYLPHVLAHDRGCRQRRETSRLDERRDDDAATARRARIAAPFTATARWHRPRPRRSGAYPRNRFRRPRRTRRLNEGGAKEGFGQFRATSAVNVCEETRDAKN